MEFRNEPNVRQEQRLMRIIIASTFLMAIAASAFFIAGNFGNTSKSIANGNNAKKYYPYGSVSGKKVKDVFNDCKNGDTLIIQKKLTVNKHSKELENKDVIILIDGGEMYWTGKNNFYLGSGSKILLNNGGELRIKKGKCDKDACIYFGSKKKVSCDGGQADFSFSDVNNAGGVQSSGVTALPVRLIRFEALKISAGVLLNWVTASEENNSHFDIERSEDGEVWNVIGRIAGNGNAHRVIQYQFEDMHLPELAYLYYRLKQVDFDGKFEHSHVRYISNSTASGISENVSKVYPNPVNDFLNIKITRPGNYAIRLADPSGTIKMQRNTSSNFETVGTTRFTNGIYYVTITNADNTVNESHRIIIRH